ncbi:Neuropeptide FF receptor 2 [Frankliniella fusca]|uniref:Neuropeptide FF receptor 2 n=1 Tax=Frankliniella fusca TaxID=407009 RepID=A0AAE1HDH6_9NEOP|nr:Neuropeptide FF receptor 2 [Frankliniella fusca]
MTTPTRHPRPHRPIKNAHDFDWPSPSMEGGAGTGALGGGLKGWSLRTVRRRIRIARAHLRHRRRHINQVYGQVKVLRKYSFDWLPQEQVPWYRAEVTCLDRDSQAAQVLPALRSALQNFSATFVELQKARKWTIDKPGLGNRSLIINELASHVKGMLCEVETAMQERALPLPPAGLPADGLAGVDASRWNPEPDTTGALIQDWGVVSAYTDALYGWALILRELGHAPKVRRKGGEGQAGAGPGSGPGPGGRGCPSEPHRLHGRHRNQLRRKQRGHPGGGAGAGASEAQQQQGEALAQGERRRGGGSDAAAKQEARRKRRRRRRKQRERRRMRRRLMEEMARQNGGRPWRPLQLQPQPQARWHGQRPGPRHASASPHGPANFS